MASWLGPFLPCWEKREAVSVEPFKNILPGILWRSGSSVLSKEELQDPDLLLGGLLLLPGPGTWGEPWRDLLLPPPDDKQDPISRALIKLIKHSKPPTQSKPLFSGDGPFGTLFNSLIARIVNCNTTTDLTSELGGAQDQIFNKNLQKGAQRNQLYSYQTNTNCRIRQNKNFQEES